MTREEIKEYIVYYRDVKGLTFSEIGNLLNISENSDKFNRQYVHQVYKRKKAYDEKYKIREDIKNKVIEIYSNSLSVADTVEKIKEIFPNEDITYRKIYDIVKGNKDTVGSLYNHLVNKFSNILTGDSNISIEEVKSLLSSDGSNITDYGLREILQDSIKKLLIEYLNNIRNKNSELIVGGLDVIVKNFEKAIEKI